MIYRVRYLDGRRWRTVGLDCLTIAEARATAALVPCGAEWRVVALEV